MKVLNILIRKIIQHTINNGYTLIFRIINKITVHIF